MALAIAFEGCAGRSAFSLGASLGLLDAGVRPRLIAGASSGAIVAALLAADIEGAMEEAWLAGADRPVWQPSALLKGGWPLRMSHIVGDALRAVFGDRPLSSLPLPVAIPVTHVSPAGMSRRILTHEDEVPVVDAVLASCFIPGPYSRVIRVGGRIGFDGAWQLRTPFDAAEALGGSRIILVSGHARESVATGFPRVQHISVPDNCRLLRPQSPLALGPFDTDRERLRSAIADGKIAAARFVEQASDWLFQD